MILWNIVQKKVCQSSKERKMVGALTHHMAQNGKNMANWKSLCRSSEYTLFIHYSFIKNVLNA